MLAFHLFLLFSHPKPIVMIGNPLRRKFLHLDEIRPFNADSRTNSIKFTNESCDYNNNSGDLGSISPAFYKQLLFAQIPKEQKRWSSYQYFCAFGI